MIEQANPDHVICPGCCHQFRAIPVNVQEELARLREALQTLKVALRVGMPEYSYEDWLDIVDTALHSATRSADSAEPFCKTSPCVGNKCQRCEVEECGEDTTPNHFCGNRWVHLPGGEQCDRCGGEV